MAGFRKKTEEFILRYIDKIDPSGENRKIYLSKFKNMSDEEFEEMIDGIDKGTVNLCIVAPNFSHVHLSVERNLAIGKELGHEFFQRVRIPSKDGLPAYLTPIK